MIDPKALEHIERQRQELAKTHPKAAKAKAEQQLAFEKHHEEMSNLEIALGREPKSKLQRILDYNANKRK